MSNLLIINGPNLNRLGEREPDTYGTSTLVEIESRCRRLAEELGCTLDSYQSNAEHEIVERIHQAAREGVACIIINPAAFTHTSVAIRDALLSVTIPFIELHLSNTKAREPFRHHSYLADVARGTIAGFGPTGYELAIRAAADIAVGNKS
jgi:3-dehydroquinate dehydratase-2